MMFFYSDTFSAEDVDEKEDNDDEEEAGGSASRGATYTDQGSAPYSGNPNIE